MMKSPFGNGSKHPHLQTVETRVAGHVFVVKGRLEAVASDVLIVPTSSNFIPRRTWWPALELDKEPSAAIGRGRARQLSSRSAAHRPAWILNVAHDGRPSVPWLMAGLDEALEEIKANVPRLGDGRVRPLIAMPTLGVGLGGYDGVRGDVIKSLLDHTTRFVENSKFDIVIVVDNAADYAALQSIRRERHQPTDRSTAAKKLAVKIRGGDVALLLGAGVSVSAGLPNWDQLLKLIKQDTLPMLDDDAFAAMNVLDRAQLLSRSSARSL